MASLTQMVVGKGIPNSFITEGLLKILRDLVPPFPRKPLPIPFHRMVGPQKYMYSFLW